MGPNGSGKSTLAQRARRPPALRGDAGEVRYEGRTCSRCRPEERAREGVFLAFQYPVEIPGVSNVYFLKAALNAIRKHRGEEELDAIEFLALVREKMKLLEMDDVAAERARSTRAFPAARRSATRSSRWRCSSRARDPRRDRLRPRHRRAAVVADGVNALRSRSAR